MVLPDGDWLVRVFCRHVRDGDVLPRARAAMSLSDVVGVIHPHLDGDEDDDVAFIDRYHVAREVAGEVQAVFNAQAQLQGVDVTDPSLGLIWQEKSVVPENLGEWAEDVPLVLVRTDFAPFTDRVSPTGGVLWIDPSTEREFVESCDRAGFVQLAERDDDAG